MIANGIFIYLLFVSFGSLNQKVLENQAETNSKINDITASLLETRELVSAEVGSITQEISLLKASAGEDFSGIIESAVKSVVTIRTDSSQGTGFIIHEDGYIVTNAHVIADENGYLATGLKAINSEQQVKIAEFIGYDGSLDIALLKISGEYEALDLEDSDTVQVGERVIAMGNPLGLQFSVSQGIVSAVHRPGINKIEAYIQTDASLNPGNSGGPLINVKGNIIGINNFKISSGESLGFALESNYIKNTVNEIALEKLNQTLIQ
jgi:S1-C subfamily serine protease